MLDELVTRSLAELSRLIPKKEISPVELTEQTLARIERLDPQLNSYITVMACTAKDEARYAEQEILAGNYRGPLHGMPISVKDMFATRGIRTTCGSKILADWVPNYDATAVARLRAAGAVIVGKTNMHEFAFGPLTSIELPSYTKPPTKAQPLPERPEVPLRATRVIRFTQPEPPLKQRFKEQVPVIPPELDRDAAQITNGLKIEPKNPRPPVETGVLR